MDNIFLFKKLIDFNKLNELHSKLLQRRRSKGIEYR